MGVKYTQICQKIFVHFIFKKTVQIDFFVVEYNSMANLVYINSVYIN